MDSESATQKIVALEAASKHENSYPEISGGSVQLRTGFHVLFLAGSSDGSADTEQPMN